MKARTVAEREEAMNKRLVLGAVAVMLAVVGGFSWFSSLQSQAVPMTREEQTAQENKRLEAKPEQFERTLTRAHVLSDKWRPWAQQHQALLKAMLSAPPEGQAALMAVWEAIPSTNRKGDRGITGADLMPGGVEASVRSGQMFTWAGGEKGPYDQARLAADPKWRAYVQSRQDKMQKELKAGFSTFHDIMIARSFAPGRAQISLWASGRITKGGWIDNPDRTPGGRVLVVGPETEIEPPYGFLR